jgi:ribosomal small subunit protein bTHX
MGKGDRKSKRGKIWRGTTGKRRHKKKKIIIPEKSKKPEKTQTEAAS